MGASNDIVSSHITAAKQYIAANIQSIIDDDTNHSDSDDSSKVSDHYQSLCTVMISKAEIPVSASQQVKRKAGLAPFFKPHHWWCCLTVASNILPQMINALIDPGSHKVLIHKDLVNTLLLHHQTLHKPKMIELAMEMNGKKTQIVL